jgi:DNA-binding NtrC family response regulator
VPFTVDAIEALQRYSWPGNVREMRNVVERLLLLAVSGGVDRTTVELALPEAQSTSPASVDGNNGPLASRVAQYEREVILAELQRQRHHITNTAKSLGLERSHLYKKCQQLGIDLRAVRGTR